MTVTIGKLASVGDAGVQISCKTVEDNPFPYNCTLDEFLRYKTQGYIETSVSESERKVFPRIHRTRSSFCERGMLCEDL